MRALRPLVLLGMLLLAACTSKPAPPTSVTVGKSVFSFEWKAVNELTLAKNDATTGDLWTARVATQHPGDPESWEIVSAPQGVTLVDRLANGTFIEHLLDTLRTLEVARMAPQGPLSSYGLAPPFYGLRWRTSSQSYELELGASDGRTPMRFASDGPASENRAVFMVEGAALRMLEYITHFDVLRHQVLLTLTSDDVDQIDLFRGSRHVLYSQRQGTDWADRKNRVEKKIAVSALLDDLTHLRIQSFEDDPVKALAAERAVTHHSTYRAVLKDRLGKATEVRFGRWKGALWATVSSRKGTAFEMFPNTSSLLKRWP